MSEIEPKTKLRELDIAADVLLAYLLHKRNKGELPDISDYNQWLKHKTKELTNEA